MTSLIYDSCIEDLVSREIGFDSDSFKVMLVTAQYTPNQGGHSRRSQITGEVISENYRKGGAPIRVEVHTDRPLKVTLSGAQWKPTSITARGAIYYKSTGNAETDPLIAYVDFGGPVISTHGMFNLTESHLEFRTVNA